ncbi:hypothetical protein O53_3923 [Microcystis aeruginosa TAIHU98]|uniref:Uncharacterized protein n=1 Tax=Microcystis aeruginosa TAIHU98 TaxID=1134457 RepID=L7E6N1_MICAE|nr:hypothetical protein O53_3923 [Microcystis aeruginosa TAIHU98]
MGNAHPTVPILKCERAKKTCRGELRSPLLNAAATGKIFR